MIYFIKAGKHVKIGYSKNPNKRMETLQTGNPKPMKLLCTLPGTYKTETGLLKSCIMAHMGHSGNTIEITDIRGFQQAGLHLLVRQQINRKTAKSKKIKERLKGFKNELKNLKIIVDF